MPKRSWFQFSLKGLLILVTAVAILLGWRLAFLKRQAAFHRSERDLHQSEMNRCLEISKKRSWEIIEGSGNQEDLDSARVDLKKQVELFNFHRDLEFSYSQAIYRPWMLIDETPRP